MAIVDDARAAILVLNEKEPESAKEALAALAGQPILKRDLEDLSSLTVEQVLQLITLVDGKSQ